MKKRYGIFAALFLLVILLGAHVYALQAFKSSLALYVSTGTRYAEAAALPSHAENPLRIDLNRSLAMSLDAELSSRERLETAKGGLALLTLADGDLDAIGKVGKDAADTLGGVEKRISPLLFFFWDDAREILVLARQRELLITDIRALSYRANFEMKKIFDRIIAEEGDLSSEHVIALNTLLPDVEAQSDARGTLYRDLAVVNAQIGEIADTFRTAW
jgi:hypothetical protein